jgi:signal recognition particle GTPase
VLYALRARLTEILRPAKALRIEPGYALRGADRRVNGSGKTTTIGKSRPGCAIRA